ncbi:hypothetical protein BDV27DRAFT_133095 [Aspergillus caelatus]|uniref:Uncharacterized protein n=1 Tax=Aspergillus caelatus TaxID=61420 RepID=A0A5N6ZUZ1_9EURO|nr:uncharacterized protein BDV27DRAFT_133095 [Aspergillus caelatus]KAE8361387.1 hypothetical protein BDV27DRAFT_133095 [Aspergillus caelatus]
MIVYFSSVSCLASVHLRLWRSTASRWAHQLVSQFLKPGQHLADSILLGACGPELHRTGFDLYLQTPLTESAPPYQLAWLLGL